MTSVTAPTQLSFLRATTPEATADRVRLQARIEELDVLIDKRSDQGVDTQGLLAELEHTRRELAECPSCQMGWAMMAPPAEVL